MNAAPFPWQQHAWADLTSRRERLPHALLLCGPEGLGQEEFARRFARLLLCRAPDGEGCDRCQSCRLLAAGTHPDLRWVTPAADGKAILVDQIRAVSEFLALRPHIARRRLVVLSPAEAMNLHAANSLLKVLEEPPPDSLLWLVSSRPARLPATVRSRCARLPFGLPAPAAALAWLTAQTGLPPAEAGALLDFAGGAPLRALALAHGDFPARRLQLLADLEALAGGTGEPTACAARWKGLGTGAALEWLQVLVANLIRLGLGTEPQALRDVTPRLRLLAEGLNWQQLFDYLEAVSIARRAVGGGLDESLLLEDLLVRWSTLRGHPIAPTHG